MTQHEKEVIDRAVAVCLRAAMQRSDITHDELYRVAVERRKTATRMINNQSKQPEANQ